MVIVCVLIHIIIGLFPYTNYNFAFKIKPKMKSVNRVIPNTVFKFVLFNYTIIYAWRGDIKEEGRKYHMETSISNSLSFFIFIHQFRLW